MALSLPGPSMTKLYFLPNVKEPSNIWKKCVETQELWAKRRSLLEKETEQMKVFKKKMAVKLVLLTNALEDTLPKGLNKTEAEEVLTQAYDHVDDVSPCDSSSADQLGSIRQLMHHLKAFKLLCQPADALPELSEDLIKQAHQIMMQGLKNEQGMKINAGSYRKITVFAGNHIFPSHDFVPGAMVRIVKEYNEKFFQPHDQYQLASWLYFSVVSLHPFEDGNGRISRLLWCYSLMRDGQPFPTVLTSGHKCSQKHLVLCLKRDRDLFVTNNPHLTTLTVVSVNQAWESYFSMFNQSI